MPRGVLHVADAEDLQPVQGFAKWLSRDTIPTHASPSPLNFEPTPYHAPTV